MALTALMAGILVVAFGLMFGLVRFTENVIDGSAPAVDGAVAAETGKKRGSP